MKKCIIALSFGDGSYKHGAANKAIAEYTVDLSLAYEKLPIIAQWELAENIATDPYFKKLIVHTVSPDNSGEYVTTRNVLRKAKKIMQQEGYEAAILVAHPAHMPRVKYTATGFMQEGIVVYTPPMHRIKPVKKIWDKDSTQPWTRSPGEFWRREMVAKVLTFLRII